MLQPQRVYMDVFKLARCFLDILLSPAGERKGRSHVWSHGVAHRSGVRPLVLHTRSVVREFICRPAPICNLLRGLSRLQPQ